MCEQKDPEPTFDPDLKYRDLELPKLKQTSTRGSKQGVGCLKKGLNMRETFLLTTRSKEWICSTIFSFLQGSRLSAFANVFKDGHYGTSTIVAMVAALLTIVFMFLDRRNEELVHILRRSWRLLSSTFCSRNYNRVIDWPRRARPFRQNA